MTLDPRAALSTIVASVSGGKDSGAMCLYLAELGLTNVRRVFADTGWEHPDTYTYLRGPLTEKIGAIEEVTGRDGGMEPLVRRKKMFPSRLKRFCTEELKMKPIQAFIELVQESGAVVNAIGIRAEESAARADAAEWEWNEWYDCWTWRPIVTWTEQQVIDIHTRHGLVPNPLYLRGARRVGCWPCIFASKGEIRLFAEQSPERVEQIAAMERDLPPVKGKPARKVPCPTCTREESEVDGEDVHCATCGGCGQVWVDPLPPMKKTYFHGKLTRSGMPLPIHDAVAWSKSAFRDREQGVLFHDLGQPAGCVRWGLCEAAPAEVEE